MIDLGYIAGFFDGEGCIGIYPNGHKASVCIRVQVTQNESTSTKEMFESFRKHFGGSVSRQKTKSNRWKLNWQLSGDKAIAFINQVRARLVVKKEQAELVVAWTKSRPRLQRNARGHPVRTLREFDRKLVQLLKLLKKDSLDHVAMNQPDMAEVISALRG